MSEPSWDLLETALRQRSVSNVYLWLVAASEKHRRAQYPAVLKLLQNDPGHLWGKNIEAPYGLAILGCASTAKKAVTGLRKYGLPSRWDELVIPETSMLIGVRALPWLPELATLLADRLDTEWGTRSWRFVDLIVRLSGAATPTSEAFTSGWITSIREARDSFEELRSSPHTEALLPMLFEYESIGNEIAFTFQSKGFNPALILLAAEDRVVRETLLSGCRARLLRGGRPGNLRPYVALHDELAPTEAECAAYVSDYIGLLSAPLSTIAGLAQRMLRAADEAGLLDVDTVLEASAIVLDRPEKALVKTQTTWLRQTAKRNPARASELLGLLEAPAEPVPFVPAVFAPTAVAELPSPITTVAELAEELAAMTAGDESVSTTERVLAAMTTLRRDDPGAVDETIKQLLDTHDVSSEWGVLAFRQLGGVYVGRDYEYELSRIKAGLFEHRLGELLKNADQPVPLLMATPTLCNGRLDPATLLDRLERAERDGWQPWTLDLEQALLRLPRTIPADELARADRLVSPAGKYAASFMRRGHRDPVATRKIQQSNGPDRRHFFYERTPAYRVVIDLEPAGEISLVERMLTTVNWKLQPDAVRWWMRLGMETLAATLPSHPEVVAAWILPRMAAQSDLDSGRNVSVILPLLADSDGPVGEAVSLAFAYSLVAKETTDRVAAVDGILGFGDRLDGEAIGTALGELAVQGAVKVNRAVMPLQEAARAGAVAMVWAICRSLLPQLLAMNKPHQATADIVDTAADCARSLSMRGQIAEVAKHAARGGSGRLAKSCQKLDQLLM